MKKALSYILLFAYSTMMLMPVLPYVSNKIAHTFWLYEHISTVHYEQGQYHTHFQSIEISKKTANEKNGELPKYAVSNNEHFIAVFDYNFTFNTLPQKACFVYHQGIASSFLQHDYPPPKV